MNTLNASIYHCHTCGRVVHVELEAEPPQCCGHVMVKSCEETSQAGDAADEGAGTTAEAPPSAIEDPKKPR